MAIVPEKSSANKLMKKIRLNLMSLCRILSGTMRKDLNTGNRAIVLKTYGASIPRKFCSLLEIMNVPIESNMPTVTLNQNILDVSLLEMSRSLISEELRPPSNSTS